MLSRERNRVPREPAGIVPRVEVSGLPLWARPSSPRPQRPPRVPGTAPLLTTAAESQSESLKMKTSLNDA